MAVRLLRKDLPAALHPVLHRMGPPAAKVQAELRAVQRRALLREAARAPLQRARVQVARAAANHRAVQKANLRADVNTRQFQL